MCQCRPAFSCCNLNEGRLVSPGKNSKRSRADVSAAPARDKDQGICGTVRQAFSPSRPDLAGGGDAPRCHPYLSQRSTAMVADAGWSAGFFQSATRPDAR
jgi:hypothetical protein